MAKNWKPLIFTLNPRLFEKNGQKETVEGEDTSRLADKVSNQPAQLAKVPDGLRP